MASQGVQDVKIFSSVRPLQIQRSFDGSSEVAEVVGSVTRDVSIEKQSSVIITSQNYSSRAMSISQTEADGGIKNLPATVVIRSSAAAPTSAASIQQIQTQSTQSKIIINPSPLNQSRITIVAATPISPVSPSPVQNEAAEITKNDQVPLEVAPARRSSLTIKAAVVQQQQQQPSSPVSPPSNPVSITPLTNSTASVPIENPAPVVDGYSSSPSSSSLQGVATQPSSESKSSPTTENSATPSALTPKQDTSEKVHPKKPASPSLQEILEKINPSTAFYVAFAVLIGVAFCILTEGEIPLSWILTAISVVSVASFIALKL